MRIPYLLALLAAGAPAAAESDRSQQLIVRCRVCHSLDSGEPHRVGPNLSGVVGSKAAARAGFAYSPALQAAGLTWDAAKLDRYLAAPAKAVPGNRMAFPGIANAADRAAIIARLGSAAK
jgi:cytochrome c